MKPEIKKNWVNALRSGDYAQADGALCDGEGFCCLGVLCDLHAKATGNSWQKDAADSKEVLSYMGRKGLLPPAVVEWAGFKKNELDRTHEDGNVEFNVNVVVDNTDDDFDDETLVTSLSDENDSGTSFKNIADLIEAQL